MTDLFPLYQKGVFEYPAAMAIAVFLGIGFGFMLERGGFGRATILVSQFYGDDMRVLKVMFSAIVTALVGLAVLGGLGVVDLGAVMVFDTFLWPQVVGGVLLGVGFIVSGHCPGTAAVASVSGNLDGLVTLGGIMLGSLGFGFVYPAIEGFHMSGAMGRQHLPELLGTTWGVLALAVTVMAIGAFLAGEWVERWIAERKGVEPVASDPALRNKLFAGMGAVAVAAMALSFVQRDPAEAPASPVAAIGADALAERMVQDPLGLFVVDVREHGTCAAKRLPHAMCLPEGEDAGQFFADLPATRTLVVYGAGDEAPPQAVQRFAGKALTLRGGFQAFSARYLTRPALNAAASAAERADFSKRNALYARFTGSAAAKAPPPPPKKVIRRAVKKGGGC